MTLTNFQGHSDVISENRKTALGHKIIKLEQQYWYQNVGNFMLNRLVDSDLIRIQRQECFL